MQLKRIVTAIAITALLLVFSAQALAVQVEAYFEPAQLSAAGTVTLNLKLTNDGSSKLSDISISGPGVEYSVGPQSIAPGESMHLPLSGIAISDAMIGVPLTYTVTYKQDGGQKHKDFSLTVIRGNVPGIEVKLEPSRTSAPTGTPIELKYTIRNTGTAVLNSITLTDRKVTGSTPLVKDLTLQPGEEFIVMRSFTMGKKSVMSQPTLSYKVAGSDEVKNYTGTQTMLFFENAQLDVEVVQGEASPEGTAFTIRLINDGNLTVKNIQVKDELGNKVNEETFTLKVGSKNTLTYVVQPEAEREVKFIITGKDGSGNDYSKTTEGLITRPYVDPKHIGLSFSARVSELLDKKTGKMTVVFTLNNSSSVSMKHMVLSEANLGELVTMDEVDTGEHVFEQVLTLSNPQDLVFELKLEDSAGNPYKYTANIAAEYFDPAALPSYTPKPVASVDPDTKGAHSETLGKTLSTLLIVLSALCAITALALIMAVAVDRKRAELRRRASYESRRSQAKAAEQQRSSADRTEYQPMPSRRPGPSSAEYYKPAQQLRQTKPYNTSVPLKRDYSSTAGNTANRHFDTKLPPDFMLRKDRSEGNVYPPDRQVRRVTPPRNEDKK